MAQTEYLKRESCIKAEREVCSIQGHQYHIVLIEKEGHSNKYLAFCIKCADVQEVKELY